MKTSRDRWMTNRYPLIEAGMPRSDCLNWWMKRYDRPYRTLGPRSGRGQALRRLPLPVPAAVGGDEAEVA